MINSFLIKKHRDKSTIQWPSLQTCSNKCPQQPKKKKNQTDQW